MTGQTVPEAAAVPAGKGLFVIGSRDPITVEQIDVLGSVGPVSIVEAPNGVVPSHADEGAGLTLVQATQGAENLSPLAVSDRLAEGVVPHFTDRAARLLLSGEPRPKPCCGPWAFRACVLPANACRVSASAGPETNASLRNPAVLGKLTR